MINVFRPLLVGPANYLCHQDTVESLTRDVHLKPIHSHNDYWRKRPLLDALLYGATSVEGDIWHFAQNYTVTDTTTGSTVDFSTEEIYVGHNQVFLVSENTLDAVYFDPLFHFLDSVNKEYSVPILEKFSSKFGIFYDAPEYPLYFWLDLKTEGNDTYNFLQQYLTRFKDKGYLASYNLDTKTYNAGPLAITLTGNVPWAILNELEGTSYLFADCPLQNFTASASTTVLEKFAAQCIFASASLEQLLGDLYSLSLRGDLTDAHKEKLRGYFDLAHEYGIKTRIWGGVDWPIWVRDAHWKSLWEAGCDLINADDLAAAANVF